MGKEEERELAISLLKGGQWVLLVLLVWEIACGLLHEMYGYWIFKWLSPFFTVFAICVYGYLIWRMQNDRTKTKKSTRSTK